MEKREMNHDYAHCLDYTKDCPKECFRAELQRDIEENRSEFICVPLTYAHLRGKEECELAKDTDAPDKKIDDAISRQDAVDLFLENGMITAAIYIKRMPSAQPERKKGEWIKHKDRTCWYCSECTTENYYAYTWDFDTNEYKFQDNYCPNCGADMREKEKWVPIQDPWKGEENE